jgi:NAD(P)-dependent dehydrogenase (short-subunit alcohol dehydrogenase family)
MAKPKQKVALVLGASAPNGIGWACVRRFAKEGMSVVVGARSFDRLKPMCDEIGALAVRCDAAVRENIAAFVSAALREHGHIDIAVNSAGNGALSSVADVSEQLLLEAMKINFLGMVNFVQLTTAAMGQRPPDDLGSVVLVSSMSVDHPNPPVFPYAAAKGATETMVRFAAHEYGPKNIRINTVNPGLVLTDLALSAGLEGLEAIAKLAADASPLRRLATAQECADAVHWLATSAFVTGMHLKVAGGSQLRPQWG